MSYVALAGPPSDVEALFRQTKAAEFSQSLEDLRRGTAQGCEKLKRNASWLAKSQTNEVCERITESVDMLISILSKKDAAGVPFYMRKPQEAQRLLGVTRKNTIELIEDHKKRLIEGSFVSFGSDWSGDAFASFLNQTFAKLSAILAALLQASAKNPAVGLALAGGAVLAVLAAFSFLKR